MINLNHNLIITAIINLTLELHLVGCHRVEKKPSYHYKEAFFVCTKVHLVATYEGVRSSAEENSRPRKSRKSQSLLWSGSRG